jgi:hypothetical protein
LAEQRSDSGQKHRIAGTQETPVERQDKASQINLQESKYYTTYPPLQFLSIIAFPAA